MAYNKVVLNGKTLIDLTEDTVNKKVLGANYTAHNAAGNQIVGDIVLSPENISTNISTDLLPPEDTTRAWIPIGQEYDTLRQQTIPYRTMTITLPTINGTDNPSLTAYAPAHPEDINQCMGYGFIRKHENNQSKLGIVQINLDGTIKVLLDNYITFNSSNSYAGSIISVVDTPEYIYMLTGYGSRNSSYRTTIYLWYFNKNTNTLSYINNYILYAQYSQSFSLYTLGNAVYIFGRHNASSTSSSNSYWYYKIFKTTIGSSTVSTIYNINRNVSPSVFIYKDLFYTTLADDTNNTNQYAIFDENGAIVDHWQTGNGITGAPLVIYNDWFIYLTYKTVYGGENGMGSSSSYIYYYYGCHYNTREVKWVASGLASFTTGNATILNNEIVGRSNKTFYFYPLIPEQFDENILTLVPRNNNPLITYNENTQQFINGTNIYDAYFISSEGEIITCGVYCYVDNLWKPLNSVTHTPVARFKMDNQLEYCDNNITWADYINTKYNISGYSLDEEIGYIKLNDNIVCEKTDVGCQSVTATDQIKPEGEYIKYQGSLDTYTINLVLTNVTTTDTIQAISRADTLTLTFTADSNYELPTSIIVNNANYTWEAETGVLQIGSPFADVEVIITAISK